MHGLTDRVAIVTGAGSGIGRATAMRLAAEGALLYVVDLDGDGARSTAEMVEDAGGTAAAGTADLADSGQRRGVVAAAVRRFGQVDVLVNNASYAGPRVDFLELPDDELDRVLAVNLTATAVLSREAARHMVGRGGGAIVNITAIQERLPLPTWAAYGASKGGVSALTRTLAAELSPRGVRVNAIAPGMIETSGLRGALAGAPAGRPATLLGRHGSPEELAAAVAFLASDEASYVTGVVLAVDGGRRLSRRSDPLTERRNPETEEG